MNIKFAVVIRKIDVESVDIARSHALCLSFQRGMSIDLLSDLRTVRKTRIDPIARRAKRQQLQIRT
jgi:hypothetical protein